MTAYSSKAIYEAASEVYKKNIYDKKAQSAFNQDVYKYLTSHKIPKRRSVNKIAEDTYVSVLDNENQNVNNHI